VNGFWVLGGRDLTRFGVLSVQIVIMVFVRNFTTRDNADFLKDVLRVIVLLQDIPRCIRFFPILIGQSPSGFVFETAWANFVINIFMYLLASHVVGCCWYLFGLQVKIRISPINSFLCVLTTGC
jgi:cyclic nucleotide gated channel